MVVMMVPFGHSRPWLGLTLLRREKRLKNGDSPFQSSWTIKLISLFRFVELHTAATECPVYL